MRIGIDLRKINDSGIGRYTQSLVHHLLRIDKKNEYVFFLYPEDMKRFCYTGNNVRMVEDTSGKYSILEHVSISRKARQLGLDLFHAPHYVLPLFLSCKTVVTIHDLIHLIYPTGNGFTRTAKKFYAEQMIRQSAKKADRIIAVSRNTKKDLVALVPEVEEKIVVIHNGVEWESDTGLGRFHPTKGEETDRALERYGIHKGYFLFVGNERVHKNLSGAVQTAKELWAEFKIPLVVIGVNPEAGRVFIDREDPSLAHIYFLERVNPEDMVHFYNGAYMLLFPSLYEGFGLPILEAMACGTPVIASNRSSIPEVAGTAAHLIDPDNPKELVQAARLFLTNALVAKDHVERGFAQIKKFSWDEAAKRTLEIYKGLSG
jgi:glycosyltransferase involved in cell wall biosynthesis